MPDGKVPLPLLQTPPRELPPRPAEVVFSEPMLRYECNRKGCCCRGWTIPFNLEDFVRLYRALPEGERETLGRGMELLVAPAGGPTEEEAAAEEVAAWNDPALGSEHATKAARAGLAESSAFRATLEGGDPDAAVAAVIAAAAAPIPIPIPMPIPMPMPMPVQLPVPPPPLASDDAPISFAPAMDQPAPRAAGQAEHVLESIRFAGVGDDEHCRFLRADDSCGVHADHGLWALPDICVNFPAFGYQATDLSSVELWFDPICPEVLRQLDAGDAPLELHRADASSPAWNDRALPLRIANTTHTMTLHLRGQQVGRDELEHIRGESLRALRETARPAWKSLAAILCAYQRLTPGQGLEFRAEEPADPVPFLAFLGGCVGAHGGVILVWALENYRRFIHATDVGPALDTPEALAALTAALEAWGPSIDAWLAPREEALRPLMLRWMGHRFGMPYVNQTGDLRACADTIAMIYGTSLRYAAALASVLGRELDRPLYQAALGAAEYFYRSLVFKRESLPWFASVDAYQAALLRVTSP